MKILILIIHSKRALYDNMLYVQQSYLLNNDIYDVFYVNMKEKQEEPITIKNNVITVRGVESLTNILYKTVKALDYIMNSLKRTYDYVVRGNISTLINRENLHTYLQNSPINEFGKLLHQGWIQKRSLSNKISTPEIDLIYDEALHAGATGGKILGAGGGGFLLLFVKPEMQSQVRERLKKLVHVPFEFEDSGSRVVLYQPNGLF